MSTPEHNPPGRRWVAWATRAVVGFGALLVALVITAVLVSTAPTTDPTDDAAALVKVPVIPMRQTPIARQWRGYGVVQPVNAADVPARVSAVVTRIPQNIDVGRRVTQGQLIAELDPEDFQRQAEIATQNLTDLLARLAQLDVQEQRLAERTQLETDAVRIARAEFNRVEKLFEGKVATQQDRDRARRTLIDTERALSATLEQSESLTPQRAGLRAQVAGMEASLKLAELNLSRTKITSPIDGILVTVDVELGENLAPGQRVARVVGLSRVEVPLNVPASARSDLVVGDPVVLQAGSREHGRWRATVSRVAPIDDSASRTAAFFAEVEQPDAEARFGTAAGADLLTPGSFVTGMVTSEQSRPRWVVPRRAIRDGRVLLVKQGVVVSCQVEPDFTYEGVLPHSAVDDTQWVALAEDSYPFQEGDYLVVNVSLPLSDGAAVEPFVPGQGGVDPPAVSRGPDDAEAQP